MIGKKLISEALVNWGLQDEKITDIVISDTGKISDSAKYVGNDMVIKYTENPENVKKRIAISKALNHIGLNTPAVIPTADGKAYVTAGGLCFTLTKKIEGERVSATGLYLEDYREKARFTGEIVGQLDLALAAIDAVTDEADLGKTVTEWAVPLLKGKISLEPGFLDDFSERFNSLYGELPRQIIHRDPNPGNIIMSKDKWGFIDFDLSEKNARLFDPCYAAAAILSETFEEGNEAMLLTWAEITKEILYGYDSIVKMTYAEKEAVPYMILANQFAATAFFAGKDEYADLYKINRAMTEWIGGNMDRLRIS